MEAFDINKRSYTRMFDEVQRELSLEKRDNRLERDRIIRKERWLEWAKQCFDAVKELQKENERLKKDNEVILERLQNEQLIIQAREREYKQVFVNLQEQVAEEKRLRTEAEMRLAELNKLSSDVAKKSSEDVLLKTIQTYVNKSKQKRPEKRAAAKEWALEMILANKLNVPEDLSDAIEHLDDEQPNPKVVNISGNYNDIHDNGNVNQK